MTALNAEVPGRGEPNEVLVWTAGDQQGSLVSAAVSNPPFAPTVVQARAGLEAAGETDPVEIGAIAAFLIGAFAGLILAFAGILMSTAADLRDERGDLADLEEQGVRPAALQRLIITRPVSIATVALALGLALGSGLLGLAAVTLTATPDGRAIVPPVLVVLPLAELVAIVVIVVVALVGVIGLVARRQYSRGLLREAD
jgi:ABC-type antimicrobial peptide transport system permease subunit